MWVSRKVCGQVRTSLLGVALIGVVSLGCWDSASSGSAGELSPAELAKEVGAAFAEPSQFTRLARLTGLLAQLDDRNLGAVRDVFDDHMAGLSQGEVRAFVSAWAQRDLAAAYDYAESIPFLAQGEEALGVAVQEWAARDPAEARIRAEALVLPGRKRQAQPLVRLVRGWVHQPDSGLEAFLREYRKRNEIHSAALQELYRAYGAEHLIRWADAFIAGSEDASLRSRTFRKTARTIGYREPEKAADWVSGHYGKDEYAADGPEILAEAWARRDVEAAIEWLRGGAPEAARPKALETTFRQWLRAEPAEAAAWLETHRDDPFAHPASVASAKQAIRARDPDRAIDFCARVPPSELKQRCLHALAIQWYEWDPVAAGRWMESSDLDPELRDSVRTIKQRIPRSRLAPPS